MRKFCFCMIVCMVLCGCSVREIDDRTPVSAAAIKQQDEIEMTAQTVSLSSEDSVPETKLETVKAGSIRQAIDQCGDEIYWTTAETILLDKDSSYGDIYDIVEQLTQEQSIRPAVRLCVADSSEKILETEKKADALQNLLDDGIENGQAVDMPLYKAKNITQTEGVDLVLPVLGIEGESVRLTGTVLFDGRNPAGMLNRRQTSLLALLRNDTSHGVLYGTNGSRYDLINVRTKIKVKDRAQITVSADIKTSSEKLAEQAAVFIQQNCQQLVENLRENNCDALGLVRQAYRDDPKNFKVNQAAYRAMGVDIRVKLKRTQGGEAR